MADTAQLDVLEKRITALESLVFGNADKDALYPKVDCQTNVYNSFKLCEHIFIRPKGVFCCVSPWFSLSQSQPSHWSVWTWCIITRLNWHCLWPLSSRTVPFIWHSIHQLPKPTWIKKPEFKNCLARHTLIQWYTCICKLRPVTWVRAF